MMQGNEAKVKQNRSRQSLDLPLVELVALVEVELVSSPLEDLRHQIDARTGHKDASR